MKNVKKIVAIVAAAIMMGAIVPTTKAFAAETKQEAVQQVALTQTAISQDSMTISWDDKDAADSNYTVVIWSLKAYAPSYGSTHTFIKQVEHANSVEFTGLEKDMPYEVVVYKSNPAEHKTDVIAEGKLSTLPDVKENVGQTAVSQNSMTLTWADEDYANSNYTVVIWSLRAYAPSYGSTHTFIKQANQTNTVTFDGLEKDMPYEVVVYKSNPAEHKTDVIAEAKLSTLA